MMHGAAEAAKRKLVQRIEKLLDTIQHQDRIPCPHESLCLRKAIKALVVGAYRQGEDDVLFAEQPDRYANSLIIPPDDRPLTLAELRDLLALARR